MKRLTLENFRRWLQTLPADYAPADGGDCYECWLARFLEAHGAPAPYVWRTSYSRDGGSQRHRPLPAWAERFAALSRDFAEFWGRPMAGPADALMALEEAERQAREMREMRVGEACAPAAGEAGE